MDLRSLARRLPVPILQALRPPAARSKLRGQALQTLGTVVHGGPFAGMQFVASGSWSWLGPNLVGSYEEELVPHLERFLSARPPLVVVIGAAEGYYAVGVARRLPEAEVVAVDVDAAALELCREVARLNGVEERVQLRLALSRDDLESLLRPGALVISDCEGCEAELMDPERVPTLARADLIVELHDFVDPEIGSTVSARFASTHDVTIVRSAERVPDPERYPALARISPRVRADLVDERRPTPDMEWAVLEARER